LSFFLAAVAAPLFAGMAFGLSWFSHNSSMKSTKVNIVYSARLANGATLKPGNYTLEIPLNTKTPDLKFYRSGRLVASAPATVKSEARKASTTEIDYRRDGTTQYMVEVRPEGLSEVLVFTKPSNMKSGS
jgi:hypothetical protein